MLRSTLRIIIIIIIINFIDIFRPEDPIVTETRKTDITQIQLYI